MTSRTKYTWKESRKTTQPASIRKDSFALFGGAYLGLFSLLAIATFILAAILNSAAVLFFVLPPAILALLSLPLFDTLKEALEAHRLLLLPEREVKKKRKRSTTKHAGQIGPDGFAIDGKFYPWSKVLSVRRMKNLQFDKTQIELINTRSSFLGGLPGAADTLTLNRAPTKFVKALQSRLAAYRSLPDERTLEADM